MAVTHSAAFNGTTSKMVVANYTGNATSFSVAAWVFLNANQISRVIFENYQATGPKGWAVGVHDTVNNKLKFYLSPNTLNSATALSITTWTYVVFTYDGTTAKIYLNGSSTPDATLATALSYTSAPANNGIGALSSGSQFFNGSLAAVGYWSKALSTTEMTALYNLGSGLAYADLSGTLLTSLVSYNDFASSTNLGFDSVGSRIFTPTAITQNVNTTISYNAMVMLDSPVSYWRMNETTGPHIADSADSNTVGQVNPTTLNQAGPQGLVSILFPGGVGGGWLAIETISAPNIEITGNISLEAWVKLSSAPVTNNRSIVLDKGYSSTGSPFDDYCLFAEGANGGFGISISIGTTLYSAEMGTAAVAGIWYHICGTYDGTNLRFYVNGILQQTTAASGSIRNDGIALAIGASIRGSGGTVGNLFAGNISNVAIYNTVLSQPRIAIRSAPSAVSSIRVSQIGVLVVDTATPNIRVSQVGVLIVDQGNPNVRLSQFGIATVYTASPNVRVSQSGILAAYTVNPKVRDSQIGALVVATGSPKVRDSQIGALVVVVITSGSFARISQEGAIVVYQGTPLARISQEGTVVVYQGTPLARVSQMGALVVWQATPPVTANGSCLLMGM